MLSKIKSAKAAEWAPAQGAEYPLVDSATATGHRHAKDGSPAAQPMEHQGWLYGALFSKDESLILTWSGDGSARLWNMAADYDFPTEHLPLLVEVFTGTQMDELGIISVIKPGEWNTK